MGSENLSGAKGNSHSRLNAHFAFLSLNLCIIHYNNTAPVSEFCSCPPGHENRSERYKRVGGSCFRGDSF